MVALTFAVFKLVFLVAHSENCHHLSYIDTVIWRKEDIEDTRSPRNHESKKTLTSHPRHPTSTSYSTWIVLAGSVSLILPSGGAVSFLYGFIFCVLCNLALAASLGEMAAVWPTAGGQYHFVYALCTDGWKRPVVRVFPVPLPP